MTPQGLARAIDSLGAVEVAPGKYGLRGQSTGCWYVAPAEYLEGVLANGYDLTALAFVNGGVRMRPWWSPEQRKGLRHKPCGFVQTGILFAVCEGCRQPTAVSCERVTADLETGAEVPA